MNVSVVLTVLNEAPSLPALLASLEQQMRLPDEVVVVDGGSSDGTVVLLQSYKGPLALRLLELPGSNISQGRNAAIGAAQGPAIAVTDAGVRLSPDWLSELMRPLEQAGAVAVAGFFLPDPHTLFEVALGATVLPALEDIDPQRFLPSSRSVAFRKDLWEKAGGYPEWLDYCEDLVFDRRILATGARFAWAPKAVAYFRPRPNLLSFFRQYYRYARGDGKANLWLKRHLVRYCVYFVGLLALANVPTASWVLVPLAVAGLAYLATPVRRLRPALSGRPLHEQLALLALLPLLRLTGDIAKMLGYPAGVWWRLRHRPHE